MALQNLQKSKVIEPLHGFKLRMNHRGSSEGIVYSLLYLEGGTRGANDRQKISVSVLEFALIIFPLCSSQSPSSSMQIIRFGFFVENSGTKSVLIFVFWLHNFKEIKCTIREEGKVFDKIRGKF